MTTRNLARTRSLFVVLAALFLLTWAAAAPCAEEAPEILKGTVVQLKNGVLTLKGVRFQDETLPARKIDIRTDKATAFYDGPLQVTKEAVVADLIVLVKCTLDGSDRKAVLVRIIGGKKS